MLFIEIILTIGTNDANRHINMQLLANMSHPGMVSLDTDGIVHQNIASVAEAPPLTTAQLRSQTN